MISGDGSRTVSDILENCVLHEDLQNVDVVVIDEYSMISSYLLSKVHN